MFRFSKKLKHLKPVIRELSKEKLGNLTKRTKEAFEVLCVKQQETLLNPSASSVQDEADAYERWSYVAGLEEEFLKQRAKLHWLEVGDQNNRTFHNAIKARQAQNNIREIRRLDGSIAATQAEIKIEAERFFSDFLNFKPTNYQGATEEELEELIDFRCTSADCNMLMADVSEEEIKKVLFAMPANKSPGPDGYSSEFFKTAWPIIGNDFVVAIQSVFRFGFLPKGVNSTILALIPKKEDSLEMRDFRPIACCNVMYKVVSKILANRLKLILPRLVLENQSAFVEGRLLMENVLLASELVKGYHSDTISPRGVMKIDISKAFDSVQWDFVLKSLTVIGVPEKFIHWIKLCITSPSFSVQVNGELAGYFQSTRGLRQGCSLSPYLFVLCMNILSHKINKGAREKKFEFHPGCKTLSLTHLCFADDLMVFVEGSKKSVEGALAVFAEFEVWSGLSISIEKSTIYMAGVAEEEKRNILSNFPLAQGTLPVRYLGLPLMTKGMRSHDYMPLVERIRGRISSWTCRYLSYAGRLQLIKAVLMSMVNFWAAVFRLPSRCMKEVEQICAAFLWTGPELRSTGAKISWTEICKLKNEGGLGIRSLKEVNQIFGLKLIWRMLSGESLWGKWLKENLLKGRSFWEIKMNTQAGSWMWRKMLKSREVAKGFYRREVGNGCKTSFWFDKWSDKGVLFDILGERGFIDLGIKREATVEDAVKSSRRRRRHRMVILNNIETELLELRDKLNEEEDVSMWRMKSGYKDKFSTQETWLLLREDGLQCSWAPGVWFSQATPKFAFLTWLAIQDRLTTMDRISRWSRGVDQMCVLCRSLDESRNHLFFECSFTSQIWEHLVKGILCSDYTVQWDDIVRLITARNMENKAQFCIRYSLQASIHTLWRERNKIRHGEKAIPLLSLKKLIEKGVRNKFSLMRGKGGKKLEGIMQFWFATRI